MEEGWIFLKIVIMSPILFSLQQDTPSCFLANNSEFAKSFGTLEQLLMRCSCQCSTDLSFCTEHTQGTVLSLHLPVWGTFSVSSAFTSIHGITENIQSSLKNSVNAPSARRVELPRTLAGFFHFSLQIH